MRVLWGPPSWTVGFRHVVWGNKRCFFLVRQWTDRDFSIGKTHCHRSEHIPSLSITCQSCPTWSWFLRALKVWTLDWSGVWSNLWTSTGAYPCMHVRQKSRPEGSWSWPAGQSRHSSMSLCGSQFEIVRHLVCHDQTWKNSINFFVSSFQRAGCCCC